MAPRVQPIFWQKWQAAGLTFWVPIASHSQPRVRAQFPAARKSADPMPARRSGFLPDIDAHAPPPGAGGQAGVVFTTWYRMWSCQAPAMLR